MSAVAELASELDTPQGISLIEGFGRAQVQAHIDRFLLDTERALVQTDPGTTMLIFPLEGSILLKNLLLPRMQQLRYPVAKLDVRFATKDDQSEPVKVGDHNMTPYKLSMPLFTERMNSRVIVLEDIIDRNWTYGEMQRLSAAEGQSAQVELWAMSRKPTTQMEGIVGYKGSAVFPLINGQSPWVNSGFGMDSSRFAYHVQGDLGLSIAIAERMASVCVTGQPVNPGDYLRYLHRNSLFVEPHKTRTYNELRAMAGKSGDEKLAYARARHAEQFGIVLEP